MKCNKCGHVFEEGSYCPQCGTAIWEDPTPPPQQYVSTECNNGAEAGGINLAALFKNVFSSPLFLVVSILTTVSAVCSCVLGSFNVISILLTIAFWMIYSTASSARPEFSLTGMKLASGTLKALWIVLWVCVGILVFAGLVILCVGPALSQYSFFDFDLDLFALDYLEELDGIFPIAALFGILFFVFAALMTALNLLFFMPLHKFAKQLCVSGETGVLSLSNARYIKNWLLVIGILSAVSAVAGISSGEALEILSDLCEAVLYIIASVWINKSFCSAPHASEPYAPDHFTEQ